MSIENIIDYVIKTPKNTNPNVIRSLVKSEVDENTLQKAKEYTDSQRLAYKETKLNHAVDPFVISAGRSTKTKLVPHADYLIVGAKYIVTINGVRHEAVLVEDGGSYYLGNRSIATPTDPDTGENYLVRLTDLDTATSSNRMTFATAVTEDTPVTIVQEVETIHRIDPKYLPGATIDLDSLGITNTILPLIANNGSTVITEPVVGLWEKITDDTPVRLKMTMPYAEGVNLEFRFDASCIATVGGLRSISADFFVENAGTFTQTILQLSHGADGTTTVTVKTQTV